MRYCRCAGWLSTRQTVGFLEGGKPGQHPIAPILPAGKVGGGKCSPPLCFRFIDGFGGPAFGGSLRGDAIIEFAEAASIVGDTVRRV